MAPPPPPNLNKQTFKINQRVLVPYTDKYYEAKILKVRRKEPGTYDMERKHESAYEYFVHYPGWNKEWDTWVSQEGMLKFSEELNGAPLDGSGGGGGGGKAAAAAPTKAPSSSRGASPVKAGGSGGGDRGSGGGGGGAAQRKPSAPAPSSSAPFNPAAARGSTPHLRSLAGSLPAPPAAVAAARAVAAAAEAEAEAAARRRKKKRSADDVVLAPAERVDAPLPPALAAALVDDHDRLASGVPPARLPVVPCVDQILAAYARDSRLERERAAGLKKKKKKYKKDGKKGAAAAAAAAAADTPSVAGVPVASPVPFEDDLADSLRDYFDKVSLKMLLYPCERRGAERATGAVAASASGHKTGTPGAGLAPGALLGGRHLLRLLVMLPALLPPRPRQVERAFGGGGGGGGAGPESATVPVDVQLRHFMRWLARGADLYLRAPPPGEKEEEEEEGEGEEEQKEAGEKGGAAAAKGKAPSAAAAPAAEGENKEGEPSAKKAKVAG